MRATVRAIDAGPVVPPSFKDDLTAAEIARVNATAAALDCSSGRCEGLFRKKVGRHEWVVHVRPSQPKPGQVAEVVVDFSELLEIADPELGEKKPLENLAPGRPRSEGLRPLSDASDRRQLRILWLPLHAASQGPAPI